MFYWKKPLGTGGALNTIKNKLCDNFLVFNADSIFDINLNEFLTYKKKKLSIISFKFK